MQMGIKFLLALNIAGFSYFSSAEELSPEQQDALDSLMELLVTDIATKTRPLDPDLAPGTVLVLTADSLHQLGIQRVGDALGIIPGVSFQGLQASPTVRGIGGTVASASGKIQYQLNGVPINELGTGGDAGLASLNIDAIDRIEIIKGPGAAVHGEFALSAVVDVITKKGKYISAGGGSGKNRHINVGYEKSFNEMTLNFEAGYERQNGQQVIAGPDRAVTFDFRNPDSSNSPGPVYEPIDDNHFTLTAANVNYLLSLQWLQSGKGVDFGTNDFLTTNTKDIVLQEQTFQTRVVADYDINSNIELSLSGLHHSFRRTFRNNQGFPVNFLFKYPVGTFADSTEVQSRYNLKADLTWFQSDKSTTSFGIFHENVDSKTAEISTNQDLDNNLPNLPFPAALPVPKSFPIGYAGRSRYINGIHLQQEMAFGDRLNTTIGVRYDRYNDIGDNFSPRAALVFEADNNKIIKASIGKAFRAPTFTELYNVTNVFGGNVNLSPETVTTTELSYIHRNDDKSRYELTMFYSEYNNLIGLTATGPATSSYQNIGDFKSTGAEFVMNYNVNNTLELEFDASYSDAKSDRSGTSFPGTGNWLSNASIIFQKSQYSSLSLKYTHVGKVFREETDIRSKLSGYNIFSLTGVFQKILLDGDISLGINNLFDNKVIQPALENTYIEDYPRPGRSFWFKYNKSY